MTVETLCTCLMFQLQLIGAALDEMVHDDDFGSISGHDALVNRVAALHVVYMLNKSQVMWFGQLVSEIPSIMIALKDKQSSDTSEMVHYCYYCPLFIITASVLLRCFICLLWRRHWMN